MNDYISFCYNHPDSIALFILGFGAVLDVPICRTCAEDLHNEKSQVILSIRPASIVN